METHHKISNLCQELGFSMAFYTEEVGEYDNNDHETQIIYEINERRFIGEEFALRYLESQQGAIALSKAVRKIQTQYSASQNPQNTI